MEKYLGKYRIPSTRLTNHDYGSNAMYFITLCTKNRMPYFGQIARAWEGDPLTGQWGEPYPLLSEVGRVAGRFWQEIPEHYPAAMLYEWVIMPDHMHGVILMDNPISRPFTPNRFGPQSGNLAAIIGSYKAAVKRYANLNQIPFEWQALYYDRLIRDERALENVRRYIMNNPRNWKGAITLVAGESSGFHDEIGL